MLIYLSCDLFLHFIMPLHLHSTSIFNLQSAVQFYKYSVSSNLLPLAIYWSLNLFKRMAVFVSSYLLFTIHLALSYTSPLNVFIFVSFTYSNTLFASLQQSVNNELFSYPQIKIFFIQRDTEIYLVALLTSFIMCTLFAASSLLCLVSFLFTLTKCLLWVW